MTTKRPVGGVCGTSARLTGPVSAVDLERSARTPTVEPIGLRATGVAVAGRLVPVEGPSAGDWVDVFDLAGGRVGLTVGDVAGHGAAAATHAGWLGRLLRAGLVNGWSPGTAARYAVEQLGDTGELFATAFVAVLDPATGRLQYTNAGHPEPVHVHRTRPGTKVSGAGDEVFTLLEPTGPMLADLFAGQGAWGTVTLRLDLDDLVLVYTDGLAEARDAAGTQFGAGRLAAQACRSRNRTPRRMLADMFAAVEAYTAAPHRDDQTALALTRTATAA